MHDAELTRAQVRELQRRVADHEDATRYLLVSQITPRFALYYNVSDDVFVMNDPTGATLFKRRAAAVAVKKLLRAGIRLVPCQSKREGGARVPILRSIRRRRRRIKGKTLKDLLRRVTKRNLHEETATGRRVGREGP